MRKQDFGDSLAFAGIINLHWLQITKNKQTGGNKMRCKKSRRMVMLGVLGMFLLLFSGWETSLMAEKQETVVYEQDFEKYEVGAKKIKGIAGWPDLPDIEITDSSHYTSTRALRVVYHPGSEKGHSLLLSPGFPTASDCVFTVSLRVKFEDVVQAQNRKNLYPYIRVNVYDEKNKQMQIQPLLYKVTTTDSESSADDNWIMLKQEFKIKEGASRFQLVMYMYEARGTVGTVYIDDIKIIQKFK